MRWLFLLSSVFVILVSPCHAQFASSTNTISITGDADVKVVPDRVTVTLGVETRTKDLPSATSQTDAAVERVIAVAHHLGVDPSDLQTDFIHVGLSYNSNSPTVIDFYTATKAIQVVLKDTSKFEPLLKESLKAGANYIYGVEFSTSELRKYRDQARALAVKAAIEKAQDLAKAGGFTVSPKPLSVTSYSYGGGSSYGLCCGWSPYYGYQSSQMSQNVVQNVASGGGSSSPGSVALGKINVTAAVTMTFQIQ